MKLGTGYVGSLVRGQEYRQAGYLLRRPEPAQWRICHHGLHGGLPLWACAQYRLPHGRECYQPEENADSASACEGHIPTLLSPVYVEQVRAYHRALGRIDGRDVHSVEPETEPDDTMDDLQLLIDLHITADRQGPGGEAETRRAIELSGLSKRRSLKVADIGCGTGASTLVLAKDLDAQIVAIDFLPEFLDVLRSRAARAGVAESIETLNASMDELPIEPGSLDAIWSEGAIYNMGFENGVKQWRTLLKPGGLLAVSELTWLTASRPAELEEFWRAQYAEMGTASSKMAVLGRNGYTPIGYFTLAEHCWLDAYYLPMQKRFPAFLAKHESNAAAQAVVAAEELESALYARYRDFVSYGYYVARKTHDAP